MYKTIRSLIGSVATAAALTAAAASPVLAKTELKVATLAPEGTPWFAWIAEWKKNAEAASNGELEMTIFPSAQLGSEFEVW
ncbi:MAG: hypothetical protein ACPGSI_18115, partial [Pikeienuella sp.]